MTTTSTPNPPTVTATRTFTRPPAATLTPTPPPATAVPSPPPAAPPTPRPTTAPSSPTPPAIESAAPSTTPPSQPPAPPSAVAALPGEWQFRADAGKGIIAGILRFQSTAAGLTGVYVGLHGNVTELSNLHATGAGVSFDLVTPTAIWHLDGTVSGDTIDGTFQTAERQIRWTAVRRPAATPGASPRS